MLEALKVALFPFAVTLKALQFVLSVLTGFWRGFKWARGKWKDWHRKPSYGSADWASREELAANGNMTPGGFCVGRLDGRTVFSHPEANVIMFGMRGSMKSYTQGATLFHASGESLITFDPKGEHHERFSARLRAKGYGVFCIDLDKPLAEAGYDPMAFFDGSERYDFDGDFDTLARLVVGDVDDGGNDAGTHFGEMSVSLVAGVLSYLHAHAGGKASIAEAAEILSVGGPDKRRVAFDRMRKDASTDVTRIAINAFEEAGDREKGSFATTLSRKLRPWVTPRYRDLCGRRKEGRWTWEDMLTGKQPVALFVTGGLGKGEEMGPFLRVFFGQACATINRWSNRERKPLPRPVKFLIDEADIIGGCKPIVNVVTQNRSAGATVFLVYQAPNQVRQNFRGVADTLTSNCDFLVNGALKTPKDYLDVSQLIGSRTIRPISKGKGGVSEGEAGRHLWAIEDFYRMGKMQHVALLNNLPTLLQKPFLWKSGKVAYG